MRKAKSSHGYAHTSLDNRKTTKRNYRVVPCYAAVSAFLWYLPSGWDVFSAFHFRTLFLYPTHMLHDSLFLLYLSATNRFSHFYVIDYTWLIWNQSSLGIRYDTIAADMWSRCLYRRRVRAIKFAHLGHITVSEKQDFSVYSGCSGNPDAKRLYDDLLSNYNKLVRPVVNVTDALTVKIKLKLSQLIDVVSSVISSRRSFLSTENFTVKHKYVMFRCRIWRIRSWPRISGSNR